MGLQVKHLKKIRTRGILIALVAALVITGTPAFADDGETTDCSTEVLAAPVVDIAIAPTGWRHNPDGATEYANSVLEQIIAEDEEQKVSESEAGVETVCDNNDNTFGWWRAQKDGGDSSQNLDENHGTRQWTSMGIYYCYAEHPWCAANGYPTTGTTYIRLVYGAQTAGQYCAHFEEGVKVPDLSCEYFVNTSSMNKVKIFPHPIVTGTYGGLYTYQ